MKISLLKRDKKQGRPKQILKTGFIPAVIYGPHREPEKVKIEAREFKKLYAEAGHSTMIDTELEGSTQKAKVLIREVQLHPVKDEPIHVSLYELDLSKPITAEIPVVAQGKAPAVVNNIGFLVTPINELEVRCLPDKLPKEIVIDIGKLEAIGDSIAVEDITLPEGVEFAADVTWGTTLAYIAPPQKEIVEEAPVEEVVEGAEGEKPAGEEGEAGEKTDAAGAEGSDSKKE